MPTRNKKRDYRAEYARRIARGRELGYSRAAARGHPKRGALGVKEAKKLGRRPGVQRGSTPTDSEVFRRELLAEGFLNPLHEARRRLLRKWGVKDEARINVLVTNQRKFIRVARKVSHSETEAYTFWYSP